MTNMTKFCQTFCFLILRKQLFSAQQIISYKCTSSFQIVIIYGYSDRLIVKFNFNYHISLVFHYCKSQVALQVLLQLKQYIHTLYTDNLINEQRFGVIEVLLVKIIIFKGSLLQPERKTSFGVYIKLKSKLLVRFKQFRIQNNTHYITAFNFKAPNKSNLITTNNFSSRKSYAFILFFNLLILLSLYLDGPQNYGKDEYFHSF
ncbi:hypothetical protein pb186bvf_005092 [Paramecium bursaria]